MKALLFSDSHGRRHEMLQALRMHRDAEVCFFLGDGIRDIEILKEDFPCMMFLIVAGNCDSYSDQYPREDIFTLSGKRILYMHGHTQNVKWGIGAAISVAVKAEADALLFGHTHVPHLSWESDNKHPLYCFNPGSIGHEYEGKYHYGILEIRDNGMLFSHGTL